MYGESNRGPVGESAKETPSSSVRGHIVTITNQTTSFSPKNYDGSFLSPIIPQIRPHGIGPMHKYQFGAGFSGSNNDFDAIQDRINKHYWTCDYSDEIFQTLRESEMRRLLVCFRSRQVEFRPKLLNLLKEAVKSLNLARTTLHLAVYLLDCFMDNYTIRCDNLRLTAITCLIVAAKIEETDIDMPKFDDLNKLVDNAYMLQEFKNVECKVLASFNFDLIRPTAATFAEYFATSIITLLDYHVYVNHYNNGIVLNQGQRYSPDQQQPHSDHHKRGTSSKDLFQYSYAITTLHLPINISCPYTSYENMLNEMSNTFFTLIDVSLNYLRFSNARPSIIASACIAAVRQMYGIFPVWTPYLVKLTDCTVDIISPFVEAIKSVHRLHSNKKLLQQIQTPSTPTDTGSNSSSILCDSPDSGVVLNNDTKSTISDDDADNCEPVKDKNASSDSEEEDEPYICLEYPLLPKRKRIF